MTSTNISFVSSRKRGMTPDLMLVKDYLCRNIKEVSFRYFTKSELSGNYMYRRGVRYAKTEFCKNLSHALSVDASIPVNLDKNALGGKRILLAIPYNYQFADYNSGVRATLKKTYSSYTHVFTFSPFARELLKNRYQLDGVEIIDGFSSPLAWDINQAKKQEQVKDEIKAYFPGIKDKKVLAILVTGNRDEENQPYDEELDLKCFIDQLGPEWFVATNCPHLVEKAFSLGDKYRDSFGYTRNLFSNHKFLYIADALVTNMSMLASSFASRRKPFYSLEYVGNSFETYVKNEYPSLYLKKLDGLLEMLSGKETYTDENIRISERLSYSPFENPCEKIQNLIIS